MPSTKSQTRAAAAPSPKERAAALKDRAAQIIPPASERTEPAQSATPDRPAFAGLVEPQIAAAGLDLTGQPIRVLSALHDIARTVDKIGDAFICRPVCEEGEGQHGDIIYNAAGEFADWLTAVSGFVMERVELEAQRRAPDPTDDDDRLCITVERAIKNGDRDELRALIRDLQAKARRDARG